MCFSQDFSITFIKKINDQQETATIYESINKPLLIYENNIYAIGSDCTIYSLIDGTYDQRKRDGKTDKRKKGGSSNERFSDGGTDERLAGGGIGDRNKSGKNSKRNKSGDSDTRNKGGNSDNRNSGGALSGIPRCEVAENGKLILYIRQDIKTKDAQIYYKHKFFNYKFFKINQL